MSDYKESKVWHKSMEMAKKVYLRCQGLPEDEKFGLNSQMKRSVISIASNIAEGSGRSTPKDVAHFVSIAQGSACELETQLILSIELGLINADPQLIQDLEMIRKMLHAFRNSLLRK